MGLDGERVGKVQKMCMRKQMQVVFCVLKQKLFSPQILKHWIFQEGSDNEEEEGEEEEEENTDYLTDSNKENETDEENTVCIVTV